MKSPGSKQREHEPIPAKFCEIAGLLSMKADDEETKDITAAKRQAAVAASRVGGLILFVKT